MVIDTATFGVITTIPLGVAFSPLGVTISPDGTRVYVANNEANSVSIIDTSTNAILTTVSVPSRPRFIAFSPSAARAYVTSRDCGCLSIFDTSTSTVIGFIAVGGQPGGVVFTPHGTRAYVANRASNTVSLIDTATSTVLTNIDVGTFPWLIALTPDTTRLYVTNLISSDVSVIDTTTNAVVATIPVDPGPHGIAMSPDGARAYVTIDGANSVALIDTATNTVVGSVPVGMAPHGIALGPSEGVGPATLWTGLKNSDDQGTQFDLRAEAIVNNTPVSVGETRCVTGLTRNPNLAREISVLFGSVSGGAFNSGDVFLLKLLTRIGTNPDGTKCSGPGGSHNNAVGLRLYFDSTTRPSRASIPFLSNPSMNLFLHAAGSNLFLDGNAPNPGTVKFKDSGPVSFVGGNPWKEIGTWSMTLP